MTVTTKYTLQCLLACVIHLDNITCIRSSFQPLVYTPLHVRRNASTGGCPQMYVDSEAACAMQCYVNTWCRVYVLGPCDQQPPPNPCLCVICQMDPVIHTHTEAERSSRKILSPKRLVDNNRRGLGLNWARVHPNCRDASQTIQSSTGVSPILALQVVSLAMASPGRSKVTARPVCPAEFSPRGLATCYSDEGVWRDQHTLICYCRFL
ncbi:hypothetical protein ElyMa_001757800 [Elysia marginata]|uniref:Apple domain-containing protein n=1 Tax=Elysia marginata TaxID=1093978 RepID=A0AAV4EAE4_9GAST|nr:hypothetical protein ElyMa_001757800 [Elysia marginata]